MFVYRNNKLIRHSFSHRRVCSAQRNHGVIPAQNYDFLYENGASAIFGPGTVIPVAAQKVIAELDRRHGA
uniref:Methylmalonyl-CoA mutase C-terminal domain-containing protein n=1 Tax=Candidatus Kentrum sp. DK TaxID=2126562 RepID=A0A450TKR7_9GAMM|nr:MAG: methylmalonyl-CoA mutase C-terminal domain-containing protein [Candidatus Kentron sp. DK]VFJ69568.1 MAG: methylmalonyl-CoA mutase C-terminal domain-containing protein [Candidatus Kentron sp. DK]